MMLMTAEGRLVLGLALGGQAGANVEKNSKHFIGVGKA